MPSERDLQTAEKLAELTIEIKSLHGVINTIFHNHTKENEEIWNELKIHRERLNKHQGIMKWLFGVGVGIQAACVTLFTFLKGHQ